MAADFPFVRVQHWPAATLFGAEQLCNQQKWKDNRKQGQKQKDRGKKRTKWRCIVEYKNCSYLD